MLTGQADDMTAPELIPLPMPPQEALGADTLFVCATQRLAQTLSHSHDTRFAQSRGWRALEATTPENWLATLHASLELRDLLPPTLKGLRVVNGFQEELVWRNVIRADLEKNLEPLFDLKALASSARQAHRLAIQWKIPIEANNYGSEEQRQFHRWHLAFRAYCRQRHLIDSARMQACLIDDLPNIPRSLLKSNLVFSGFDHFTPLEQQLQSQLARQGVRLYVQDHAAGTAVIRRVAPLDLDAECQAIAFWAQQHLNQNPTTRLGIVVPDLANYQYPLQDALEDRLAPEHQTGTLLNQERLFNVSLGRSLAATPITQTALTLLQIIASPSDIEQTLLSSLLLSPYWSQGRTEQSAQARLDAAYRSSVAMCAPLRRYVDFANWFLAEHRINAPYLSQHLMAIARAEHNLGGDKTLSEWCRLCESLLHGCGWLYEGPLNSVEFQTRQAFLEALSELGRLDQITNRCPLNEAIALLKQLCQDRLFQPKTQGNPPIQILGILESTGLQFDALWVAGLTESHWPPPARPNPLLSIIAQRAQNAPNASAAVQLEFARVIQERLLHAASEVTLSAPSREADTELHPSSLIADIPLAPLDDIPPLPWIETFLHREANALMEIEDATAPAVESGTRVRGGTALLRAQAICPAWGYFQYRLGARPLQTPLDGLDARQRGTLVHNALEAFWKKVRDLSTLQQLAQAGLSEAIDQAVSEALAMYQADKRNEPLNPRPLMLEQHRLCRLLESWLRLESEREDPFRVLHLEHEFKALICGIEVRMFIDRIDQLHDGRILIVDYKTGASIDIKNWGHDRLTEPQLPIYASIAPLEDGEVAGVAFAQVHLSKLGFRGIGDNLRSPVGIDDLQSFKARKIFDSARFPDWQHVLDHWRQAVENIATEVCRGDAAVRFENDKDLIYCDVRPLLRLAERTNQFNATAGDQTRHLDSVHV
jgi:probable DNA repair protein